MPKMNVEQIEAFLAEHFPQATRFPGKIERVGDREIHIRVEPQNKHLRPGGTVSGPLLMGVADTAMFFLLLSELGPMPFAFTTSLNINFFRPPPPEEFAVAGRLLKLGKRLAIGEVLMGPADELIAQATVTYSIPPT